MEVVLAAVLWGLFEAHDRFLFLLGKWKYYI